MISRYSVQTGGHPRVSEGLGLPDIPADFNEEGDTMKKILITGCAGFIGGHLSKRFLKSGARVTGIDNLSRSGANYTLEQLSLDSHFTFHKVDVRDAARVDEVVKSDGPFDVIIHEAGQVAVTTSVVDPREDFEVNALGTFNILEATRKFSPEAIFMFASTNKVYGGMKNVEVLERKARYESSRDYSRGISESFPLEFHSPYGCSKGAADQYVTDYRRIYGLKTFVFRQSCIYGTWQFGMEDQGWVAWFVIAAILGKPITIFGDGKQIRDLLWLDDLVDLYELTAERGETFDEHVFNVGGGVDNTLSLLELVSFLKDDGILTREIGMSDPRPGDQKVFVSDIVRVADLTGWKPKVSPKNGVGKLVDWVKNNTEMLADILKKQDT